MYNVMALAGEANQRAMINGEKLAASSICMPNAARAANENRNKGAR